RSTREEVAAIDVRDDVANRQPQRVRGGRCALIPRDDPPPAFHEVVERAHALGCRAVGRRIPTAASTAASTAAAAAPTASAEWADVLRADDDGVETVAEISRAQIGRRDERVLEAVGVEQPL